METSGVPSIVEKVFAVRDARWVQEQAAQERLALMRIGAFLTQRIPERKQRESLFNVFADNVDNEAVRARRLFNNVSLGWNPSPKHMAAMVAASFMLHETFARVTLVMLPEELNNLAKENPEKRDLYAGGLLGVFEGFASISCPTNTLRTVTVEALECLLVHNPKKWRVAEVALPNDLDGTFQNVIGELKEKDRKFLRLILGAVSNHLRTAEKSKEKAWEQLPSLTKALVVHLERSATEIWERLEGMSDIPSAPVGKPFKIPPGWEQVT